MIYLLRFWTAFLALLVFAGNVHAEDKYPLFNNIVEDFKYLATSPARLDAQSALLTLGAVGVGVGLYFADENIRAFFRIIRTLSLTVWHRLLKNQAIGRQASAFLPFTAAAAT